MAPTPERRKAKPPRVFAMSKVFSKDWRSLQHSGLVDMQDIKDVMLMLISGDTLATQYLDHALQNGQRDCHIRGDLVLLYTLDPKGANLDFDRVGSHNQVFPYP